MMRSAMSANAAVTPETYATASPPAVASGTTSERRWSTRSAGRLVLRGRLGRHEHDRDRLLLVELRLPHRRDVVEPTHAAVDPLRGAAVAVDVDDDRDRAVEAAAEALPRAGRRRAAPSAASAASPGRTRRGGRAPTVAASTSPATRRTMKTTFAFLVTKRPQRATSVRSRAASESSIGFRNGTLQPVDLVPELRQDGDQQRVRDQHRRQDAERRADPELRHEVEPEEREAGDGDRDREPRRRAPPGRRTRRPRPRRRAAAAPRAGAVGSA